MRAFVCEEVDVLVAWNDGIQSGDVVDYRMEFCVIPSCAPELMHTAALTVPLDA